MHPATVSATWPSAPQAVIATVAVAKVEKLVNPPSTPLPQKNPGWKYPNRAEPTKLINSKGQISACGHARSEEHTSELQSRFDLVCRLLLEKKKHEHT